MVRGQHMPRIFSGKNLVVSSSDGKTQRVIANVDRPAGLAVPSPDGMSVPTFRLGRSIRPQPGAKILGNTAVWVVSMASETAPHQLTAEDPDTTTGLRCLATMHWYSIGLVRISSRHARANLGSFRPLNGVPPNATLTSDTQAMSGTQPLSRTPSTNSTVPATPAWSISAAGHARPVHRHRR